MIIALEKLKLSALSDNHAESKGFVEKLKDLGNVGKTVEKNTETEL